jgi:hypothetical protein
MEPNNITTTKALDADLLSRAMAELDHMAKGKGGDGEKRRERPPCLTWKAVGPL